MFKLVLEKPEEPEIKLPASTGFQKSKRVPKNVYCFIDYAKAFDCVSSVQSLCRVRLFTTPWTTVRQASLSITNSWSLLKVISIELVLSSNHLILCHPFLLQPSIFPSIRVFSNESALCIRTTRSQQTVKNSSRDWNTRPPYLSPVKSVCRSRSNS